MGNTERQFIRHPTAVPLLFNLDDRTEQIQVKDVGNGGLCFTCHHSIDAGEHIHITISISDHEFDAHGIVRWCEKNGNDFLIGVAFQQESVIFAVRMIEQVCHIENYRKKILAETGTILTTEQAAREWIAHYAQAFPSLFS